jgi:hypothetical protein
LEQKDLPANDAEFDAIKNDFNENVIESGWSENGELIYILKDGSNVEQYAKSAEIILNSYWEPEMDFVCKVMHADGKDFVSFKCDFDAKHLFEEANPVEDEPMDEFDTLEDFKGLWPDYFLEKLNSDEDIEFPVSEGVDLAKTGKLILEYINETGKIDIPITIVLNNLAGEKEILSVPANI